MVGKTLGHYEILEPLGKGGMGEVYRARDTTLDRDVAIKVLPEDFATDPDRLARFEREAKLLASLNHANIASIYGLEDEGDQRFIVMEVVEGETLAERISRSGRIDVDEALEIARQIAEALEAAHENGVIHRDLKPANVIVTPDGKVKVLDFGLAKAYEADGSVSDVSPDLSHSPTMMEATRTGVILGTAAYMSPEQAKGKPLDKRTDIWAFGCVLYEMLTAQRAFGGEDVSETLAGILKGEPEWSALPRALPSTAQGLLRRCLCKDPNGRVHDIADARIEIQEAAAEPTGAVVRGTANRWQFAVPWALAILMAAIAAGAVLRIPTSPALQPSPLVAFPLELSFSSSRNQPPPFVISPDGSLLVYRNVGQLHRMSMGTLTGDPIPGTEGAGGTLFFSPDGQQVAFTKNSQLWKVSVDGGAALLICNLPSGSLRGASWGIEGTIVFAMANELWRVSDQSGNPEPLTTLDAEQGEFSHRWPQLLPGGRGVLFNITSGGNYDNAQIVVLLSDGTRKVLPVEGSHPRYVPGYLLYARTGTLIAVPFDIDRVEVTGESVAVLDDLWVDSPNSGSAHYSVSDAGVLVYQPERTPEYEIVMVNRRGDITALNIAPGPYDDGLDLSPDDRYLTYSDEHDIFVYDLLRESSRSVVSDRNNNKRPRWGPGGNSVLFSSNREGPYDIYRLDIDGGGSVKRVVDESTPAFRYVTSASRDGVVLYQQSDPDGTGWDIYSVSLENGGSALSIIERAGNDAGAVFSPNGRLFAFRSAGQVWVRPYPDHTEWGPGRIVSTDRGSVPVWRSDGAELFYLNGRRLMVVKVTTDPEFSTDFPRQLLVLDPTLERGNLSLPASYDVTQDGERFVFRRRVRELPPLSLFVKVNWLEALKSLVPTGR